MSESNDPEQDDRSRRIEALRNLAQQGGIQDDIQANAPPATTTPSPFAPLATSTRRSRKPLLVVVISALVLIAVAGGLIAHVITAPSSPTHQQQAFVSSVLHPGGNDAACPQDVSWSPDGATVAFLGYRLTCPSSSPAGYAYHAGVIVLYNVVKGTIASTINPDPIIAAALGLKPPTIATPRPFSSPGDNDTSQQVVDYMHLLWSPDGKQLAVTFSVLLTTGVAHGGFVTKLVEGVFLLSPSGGNTQVLSHALVDDEVYSGLWNLSTGAYIPPATTSSSPDIAETSWNATQALMPPTSAYQWTADGHLQPFTPSTTIGRPDGGKDFSVWQPGAASLLSSYADSDNLQQPPQTLKTPVEIWQSSFAAWSANGKYLLADSSVYGWRIAVAGQQAPDKATLAKVGLVDAPILQTRDAALAAVLKTYQNVSLNPAATVAPVNLAWSPDGKRLAVEAPFPDLSDNEPAQFKDYAVHIYDCASGKLLGVLTPNVTPDGDLFGTVFLRWSPDSSRLLLYDSRLSGAQIWGPGALPR